MKKPTKKVKNNNEDEDNSGRIILYIVVGFLLVAMAGYIFYLKILSTNDETGTKSDKDSSPLNNKSPDNNLPNNSLPDKKSSDPGTDTPPTDQKTTNEPDSKKNEDGKTGEGDDSKDFFPETITNTSSAPKSVLKVNEKLKPGESLISPNGQYQFTLQSDGKLAFRKDGTDIWISNETAPKGFLLLQKDNNLVLYDESTKTKWASNSNNQGIEGEPYLQVQDDGEVILYDKNKSILWSTFKEIMKSGAKGTKLIEDVQLRMGEYIVSDNGWHQLQLQNDGKLVLKKFGKEIVWKINSNFTSGFFMVQTDRNLVIYGNSTGSIRPEWASDTVSANTSSHPFLVVTNDCLVAAYHSTNILYWDHINGKKITTAPTT